MPTRVDLGRVFPGLVVLLIGLGLFALWIVLVFVSFFAFFVPPLQGIFSFALGVLVASIVIIVAGGLMMFSGISGWRGWRGGAVEGPSGEERESWFGRVASRRAFKDHLGYAERSGEIIGIGVMLFVGFYFVESQARGTGFFTSAFKGPEEFFFYGPWVLGMLVGLARAVYGRRNAIRPFDATNSLFTAVSAFYLLAVFPFAFSHLPDLLPQAVRFMFWWVNDDVGALVLVLAGLGSLASTAYTSALYFVVRSQLRHGLGAQAPRV